MCVPQHILVCMCTTTTANSNHGAHPGCLTIEVSAATVCVFDLSVPANERCSDQYAEANVGIAGRAPVIKTIDINARTVDHYGNPLQDKCSICLRHADVVAVDQSLSKQTSLALQGVAVATPSRANLPTLIAGGAAAGNFTVFLELTNWLNRMGRYVLYGSLFVCTYGSLFVCTFSVI